MLRMKEFATGTEPRSRSAIMMVAPTKPGKEEYVCCMGQKQKSALTKDVRLNQLEEDYASDMVPRIHANTKDATIMPR